MQQQLQIPRRVRESVDSPSRIGIELQMVKSDEIDRGLAESRFRAQVTCAMSTLRSGRASRVQRVEAITTILRINDDPIGYDALTEDQWRRIFATKAFWEAHADQKRATS
ncbi:hypothetical protein KGQ24_01105 [Patescibacteria group bacterium]|nr:hypothetical protein [Patescibacteria group bacterium]